MELARSEEPGVLRHVRRGPGPRHAARRCNGVRGVLRRSRAGYSRDHRACEDYIHLWCALEYDESTHNGARFQPNASRKNEADASPSHESLAATFLRGLRYERVMRERPVRAAVAAVVAVLS